MTRSGPAVSLRLVAVVVVVSSLLLGAGWITASIRDQGAREAIESLRAEDALTTAERSGVARLTELRAREDGRPFYLYSHYYVPPDLLTLTDAIAVSPLADAQPDAPVIGWFQVDPDGTVRTPLTPEPSVAPTGLEARLTRIARSDALGRARSAIAQHEAGRLAARAAPPPVSVPEPRPPRVRVPSRVPEPAEPVEPVPVTAPPQQALPVLMNQQANHLASDIQRAQAGDPESYERAQQSTQTAFVQQVVGHGPPPQQVILAPAQGLDALPPPTHLPRTHPPRTPRPGRRSLAQREAPSEPAPPPLPAVTAIDVHSEPMRWFDVGDVLVLARVVSSDLGGSPGEELAVLQGVALDRAALLAWLREALVNTSTDARRVTLVDSERGCALARTNDALPPATWLCLREASSADFVAEQRASMRTDIALVSALVLFVLLALLALARLARREAELAAQRSDFVTAVSHELRTPLTTLRMHSEMLTEGLVTPDRMDKVFTELSRESARMARLVDNVLEASRLEAGKRVLHATQGDVARAAERIVDEHRSAAEARGMTLTFRSDGPGEYTFDEAALERILANLIDNAIKYAEGSADPTIEVSVTRASGSATLRVSDHGPGIPVAERERVFERFHRVIREDDAHRPGTGLGLALVRELARAHGGDASIEAPATGTTVVVVLASLPTA